MNGDAANTIKMLEMHKHREENINFLIVIYLFSFFAICGLFELIFISLGKLVHLLSPSFPISGNDIRPNKAPRAGFSFFSKKEIRQ